MKKTTALILVLVMTLVFSNAISLAAELSYSEIASGYYKSYEHEQRAEYKEAIRALEAVYKTYPNTYTVNYRMGWLYYLNKNHAKALEHLQKALMVSPSSVEVMNTVNLVYAAREEWQRVEEQAVKVLKIDYYNHIANYWFSHALKMQKKYDLAIKVDRKMLAVFPTSVTFLQELGENLFLDNKKEESASVFYNLKILSPTNETADYYLKKLAP